MSVAAGGSAARDGSRPEQQGHVLAGWAAGVRRHTGWALFVIALGLLVLSPLVALEAKAFANGAAGFTRMVHQDQFAAAAQNTVLLALGATVFAVVCGTSVAVAMSKLSPRARTLAGPLPIIPLVVPSSAVVIGWVFLLSPDVGYINQGIRALPFLPRMDTGPFDVYTVPWIIIILGMSLTPFVYVFVDNGLKNLGQEYGLAAEACGANQVRAFFTITLPLLRTSVVYAATTTFLVGLGTFTVPLFLGVREGVPTLTYMLWNVRQDYPLDYGLAAALGTPLMAIGIVMVIVQRFVIGDATRFVAAPGEREGQVRTRSSRVAVAVIMLYVGVSTVLPVLALISVAFAPYWSGKIDLSSMTLLNVREIFGQPQTMRSIWGTLRYSALAIAILLPLGFLCATSLRARSSAGRLTKGALGTLTTIPLATPATLLGFGIFFAFSSAPIDLYGTGSIVVLAFVILMLPYATRYQYTVIEGVSEDMREASAATGAGRWRTALSITLPLARKGVAASAAMIFVLLSHELSVILMVRSTAAQSTLSTLLWDQWSDEHYPEVAVIALLTVVVTMVGVIIALLAGGRKALGGL